MRPCGAAIAGLALLASVAPRAQDRTVAAREAWAEANAGRLVVIDVRSPDEWAMTGTPRGALRISIEQSFGDEDFVAEVLSRVGYDRARAIALICSGGERSRRGGALLQAAGFVQIRRVGEGVRGPASGPPGWAELGLPMDR